MRDAMGGYFEMELPQGRHPYPDACAFNSARSAFQALLRVRRVRRVHLPYFLCGVMPDAARSVGVEVVGYGLDEALELTRWIEPEAHDAVLYVDYFGLKTDYIRNTLATRYRHTLIVDNSQAMFAAPIEGLPTLYSPRKFVGVPDGGWLVNAPEGLESPAPGAYAGRFEALIGRLAAGPEAHYADFQAIEHALGNEGLAGMSAATSRLLDSIDYRQVQAQRQANFAQVHDALAGINRFAPALDPRSTPLCYPLLLEDAGSAGALRAALLQNRVFVPCYWREVLDNPNAPTLERELCARLLPLPIDQRYGPSQMARLAGIIHKVLRTA